MLRITLLTAGLIGYASAAAVTCDPNAFDKASAEIIPFGTERKRPQTKEQVQQKCAIEKTSLKFAEDYTEKCISGLANGMMKIFLEGAGTEINNHCTDGPLMDELLRLTPCFNEKTSLDVYKCNLNLASTLEAITLQPKHTRVPLGCCIMDEYSSCITKHSSKCGKESSEYANRVIRTIAGDLLDTVCSKFKANGKGCKNLPRVRPVAHPKFKSLLPPLSVVLGSLST